MQATNSMKVLGSIYMKPFIVCRMYKQAVFAPPAIRRVSVALFGWTIRARLCLEFGLLTLLKAIIIYIPNIPQIKSYRKQYHVE